MEVVSKTFKQRFQYRKLWGSEPNHWNNNAPNGVYLGVWNGTGTNTPEGVWTVAWFMDCLAEMYAYTMYDEDPTDLNVYVHINIHCNHNQLWTSNDVAANGYIDIGAIYLNPNNLPAIDQNTGKREALRVWHHPCPSGEEPDGNAPIYLENPTGAKYQLEQDIGASRGAWLGGVICNTKSKEGQLITPPNIPDGGWGVHNGTDANGWDLVSVLTFGPDAYDGDGKLKLENVQMPFYIASRGWTSWYQTDSVLESLFDFDIVGDSPFVYIPWAIKKSGNWVSCNRRSDGLSTRKSSNWSTHIIVNSPLNPNVPGDSSGFRKTGNKWRVSPLTPEE